MENKLTKEQLVEKNMDFINELIEVGNPIVIYSPNDMRIITGRLFSKMSKAYVDIIRAIYKHPDFNNDLELTEFEKYNSIDNLLKDMKNHYGERGK